MEPSPSDPRPEGEHGRSLRAIAGAVGVEQTTVRRDLSGVAGATPAEVRGQDGKRYPAKRPTIVGALDQREAEKAQYSPRLPTTGLQNAGAGVFTQHFDDDRAAELVLDRRLKERQ